MANQMNHGRFHRFDEITLKDLRDLDRDKTVVLIPVGMLEEHGDHLPLGTDSYAAEALTLAAVAWLLEHDKALHALVMPLIPYGTDAIDRQRPELFNRAGSVWISRETLKAIVRDVAGHMIRFGFRSIFPIGFHGGPDQSVALDEVCLELRGKHQGLVMFEPVGYVLGGAEKDMSPGLATLLGRPLTTKEDVSLQGSIHASMFETSMMLSLRPELVDPSYRRLRTIEWKEMFELPDWPGYVGAGPAHADPAVGGAVLRWRGVRCGALIRRAMTGEDLSGLQRHPKWLQAGQGAEDIAQAPSSVKQIPEESDTDTKPELLRPASVSGVSALSDDPNATPPSSSMQTKTRVHVRRDQDDPKPR